ncbi:type II toxin-antitoxin system RelE/ParE family toxin [Campylobacter corcagiensis]|uniref:Type II toxin-antitoxin system RelE/ParE family toxin n=1 Tax=Campylobacter corcagiensis TaxID=1448857 RepID=A0A7M1LHD3_9BACT|nr:type II toxin-antitoxin system RelE/ParE family toxin [Campylobacter corcagiensis]QKF64045.1 toxin-antitoxin system, toxin component, RelE/ParE family [Campylobacter corcagiensis]QOQ87753.1 type II toxin-antitoxin system RelE/ParE family toxin [Campylobacter corcagiensis]
MVVFNNRFEYELKTIHDYIKEQSPTNAKEFTDGLFDELRELPNHPKAYRKSIKFDDETKRDLIYKGFVIPYSIETNGDLLILGIYKANQWKP